MECADAKLRMEPYASGSLVAEERVLFEAHLSMCEGCRVEMEVVRAMGSPKADAPAGDEWTLDRIFGPEAPPASAGAPSNSTAAASVERASAETLPAEDQPADGPPAEEPMLFETTPSAVPPESPAVAFATAPGHGGAEPSAEPAPAALELEARDASSVAAPTAASARPTAKPPTPDGVLDTLAAAGPPRGTGGSGSWDFEPADARPDASVPEGSLFFAEEALSRQSGGPKGKRSMTRLLLWGAGGIVGVGLLGLSIWIAVAVQQPAPISNDLAPRVAPPSAPEPLVEPAAPPVDEPGSAPTQDPAPMLVEGGEEPATPPASGAEPSVPAPGTARPQAPAPSGGSSQVIGARALSGGAPSTVSPSRPAAPKTTATAPKTTAAAPKTTATAPRTAAAAPRPSQSSGGGSAGKPAAGTPDAAAPPPPASAGRAAGDERPPTFEQAAPSESDIPFSGAAKDAAPAGRPVEAQRQPSAPAAPSEGSPRPDEAPAEDAAPPPPAKDVVKRPIDRLHLATETAERNGDLAALRKMRGTWKDFVKSSVGPDRARAKRELADCLWAIQTLTGRTSDKKDALAAYREYLLNAPAGGADARTVSRMRQLEDALAEGN